MRSAVTAVLFFSLLSSAFSEEDSVIELCDLDENELYFPVNLWLYFDSIEKRCSLEEGEALIMENSLDDSCIDNEEEELDLCVGESTIRGGGVRTGCQYQSIEKYNEDSSFKFSTKFKRRIYATRLKGQANILFKSKGKGAARLFDDSHECF